MPSKQLLDALTQMPKVSQEQLLTWAMEAEKRNPVETPAYLDKLMASGGPGRARYRSIEYANGSEVVFRESPRPFDNQGKQGRITLAKWQKWAAKATIQHKASLQTRIYGLPGYWVEWEILDACQALGLINNR